MNLIDLIQRLSHLSSKLRSYKCYFLVYLVIYVIFQINYRINANIVIIISLLENPSLTPSVVSNNSRALKVAIVYIHAP
jgi:hypothetical protein